MMVESGSSGDQAWQIHPAYRSDLPAALAFIAGCERAECGRRVGHALLQHTFALFHARGLRRVGLGVDSQNLTGPTRLYERAGMRIERQYAVYAKALALG